MIFEAKTASAYKKDVRDNGVPLLYVLQVQHYMCVTGARKAYVAALVGGNQFYCRTVERDEKLILFWFFCKIGKYIAVNYVINTAL